MKIVSMGEKLAAQMKNIELILVDEKSNEEKKIYLITQQMSYLNSIINSLLEPLREKSGMTELIQMANETFEEFNKGE